MRSPIDPTIYRLLRDVSAGIRVLQSRDGVFLSENQVLERASNIVMGLVGNYNIQPLDVGESKPPPLDPDPESYATLEMATAP